MTPIDVGAISTHLIEYALIGVIGLMVTFFWKLPSTLSKINENLTRLDEHMSAQTEKVNSLDGRVEIHDRLWSRFMDDEIDSVKISKGAPFPKFREQ